MQQRLGDVILLSLEKHAHHSTIRALQFTTRHAAPAAAALVGFLEPFGLHVPEIVERTQAVLLEQRLPVWGDVWSHVSLENEGRCRLWQQTGDNQADV